MKPDGLCNEGQRMREQWAATLGVKAGNITVYAAMRVYFHHKNTCARCVSDRLLEQNRLFALELFKEARYIQQNLHHELVK